MKKILLLFVLVGITSCEPIDYYTSCGKKIVKGSSYYDHIEYDYFCAETLIGSWQCCYGMRVGNVDFKSMKFINSRRVDITMCDVGDIDYYTETFTYSYYGRTLKFTSNGRTISFQVTGYIFPELYLRDSYGNYTMRGYN